MIWWNCCQRLLTFKRGGKKGTWRGHRWCFLGSVYLSAIAYKKNEYFMFFFVDAVKDSVISNPHFSFSVEGSLMRITKSIQVA